MKEERTVLELDSCERGIVITALNDMRNDKLREDKPTDMVDDVLLKAIEAPRKRVRILERDDAR